ncbi:MAG: hypothetical protein ABDH28_02960 [Brevinematia bacterium]
MSRTSREKAGNSHVYVDAEEIRSKVLPGITKIVEEMGYELVELKVRKGKVLSLEIEIYSRERNISLRDCERVSSVVSRVLDMEDPIPVRYNLVVSSPGVDRVFRSEREYRIFTGREVEVKVNNFQNYNLSREVNTGKLIGIDNDVVKFEINGREVWVDFSDIVYTKLYFDVGKYFGGE